MSEILYIVSEVKPRTVANDQLLSLPDTDSQGRVLFRTPMAADKYRDSLAACIEATRSALNRLEKVADGYRVEEIKLSLGLDASVGCTFLSEGKFEASIEVVIKRAV